MSLPTYKVLSIDPSYRRTGVFTDYTVGTPLPFREGNVFSITRPSAKPLEFTNLVPLGRGICRELITRLGDAHFKNVIMEYPPPRGSMSPALYALDALFYDCLLERADTLYMVPCNAIKSFIVNQVSKTDVVQFVTGGITLSKKLRFNHDEASAVLLYDIVLAKLKGTYKGTVYRLRRGNLDRL